VVSGEAGGKMTGEKKPVRGLKFTIIHELNLADVTSLSETLDKLTEYGSAEIVDVELIR
jgi:hypothetical protein